MAKLIFGVDLRETEIEWLEEGLEPSYGSVENDLLVQEWEMNEDPVTQFKSEGFYDKLKEVVHSRNVTGTFYRTLEFPMNPKPGDTFYFYMSTWTKRVPKSDPYITMMKLVCENVPGIELRYEVILGECKLTVTGKVENTIEVRITI